MTRAVEFIEQVVDEGSFRPWDDPLPIVSADGAYRADLRRASERTGSDESVIAGTASLGARRVAIVVSEFGFLAGSIGVAAAERLVRAVERATVERLPLLAAPASGGTRMQEGTVAFLQMVKISVAVTAHKAAGLPYLVYLRHPTTGGVLASWGSLGQLTVAEPGALIGFLGPRVYEVLHGQPFPSGVQTAENLAAHGVIDAVVPVAQLRAVAIDALSVLAGPAAVSPATGSPDRPLAEPVAWDSIERSRRGDRPGSRELLREAATNVTRLRGTAAGEAETGLMTALAKLEGQPCLLIGHDRRATRPIGPAGLRQARRALRLAAELRLPVVTIIDTAGAELTRQAEEGALAGEIARLISELSTVATPTVSVLLGQGSGGAALALVPADRVLCAQHAWLAPLPPEGASAITYHSADRAGELAQRQGVRSVDLLRAGIVDRVIPEHPDAADEPAAFLHRVGLALAQELACLRAIDPTVLTARRLARYRSLGLAGITKNG